MGGYNIYIVEDDPWYGEIIEYHLGLNPDYKVSRFTTAKECLEKLHLRPDLVTIDFALPDMAGDQLFQRIREIDSLVPVIVISGQENIKVALKLLKMGVTDYLVKDDSTKDLLWNSVIRVRENQSLKKEVEYLKDELVQKFSFEKTIIGQSPPMKKMFLMMEKAAKTNINVSIMGETGTGKEVVAKAIHYNSTRRKGSFIAVNMAAIPADLIESELFGHEKGAFTGAVARKSGKFEEANGGTIFLDEIAEMDLNLQSRLLRVLQEREVVRVGGTELVSLNVRLLVATHKNLAEEVAKGHFREDLYYRIIGMPIELPPLRNRGGDILILAKHFLDEFTKENKLGGISIEQDAKDKLMAYSFPGNVRELKAMIDLGAVMCNGKEMFAADITYAANHRDELFVKEEKSLRQYNFDIVNYFLKKYNHDIVNVAEKLEIGKSTIYKMIKQKAI